MTSDCCSAGSLTRNFQAVPFFSTGYTTRINLVSDVQVPTMCRRKALGLIRMIPASRQGAKTSENRLPACLCYYGFFSSPSLKQS